MEEAKEDLEDANELVKQQTQGTMKYADGRGTMKYADGRVRVYVSLT